MNDAWQALLEYLGMIPPQRDPRIPEPQSEDPRVFPMPNASPDMMELREFLRMMGRPPVIREQNPLGPPMLRGRGPWMRQGEDI